MKNIRYWGIVFCFVCTKSLLAQQTTLPITLEEAREIALSKRPDILSKQTELLISQDNVDLEKMKRYPNVYGDFNLQRNLIIPVTPVPAKAFNPDAPSDEILPLQFSTKWTGNTGINASFDVFNPNLKSQVKIKQMESEIAKTDIEIAENEALFTVSNAYVAALIAEEQLRLNTLEVEAKSNTFKMLTEQFDKGRITLVELNQGNVDLNLSQTRKSEARGIFDKAIAQLLYELGYHPDESVKIVIKDNIESLFREKEQFMKNGQQSLTLRKIEQQKDVLQFKLKSERFKNYPTISLGGYYGANYFDNNFDTFKDQNLHGNSYIKLGVKVPITDWFSQRKNRSVISRQYQINELTYQDQQNLLALNVIQSTKDVESAYERYTTLKENFILIQQNFELIQQLFKEGRILVTEIYNADYNVQKSKNDYLTAAYDYILAQLKFENDLKK